MKILPPRALFACATFLCAASSAFAGSAAWNLNPSSGDWNTAANWTPQTVPNSTTDIATFDASNVTNLLVNFGSVINVDSVVFDSAAPPYTITLDVSNLKLNGTGFVNNSGSIQSVSIPEARRLSRCMFFYNSASAGNMTSYSTVGGLFVVSTIFLPPVRRFSISQAAHCKLTMGSG